MAATYHADISRSDERVIANKMPLVDTPFSIFTVHNPKMHRLKMCMQAACTIYRIRQRWAIVVELESFGHDGAATKHRHGQRVSKECNSSSSDRRMATPSGMTGSCMHVSACRCIPGGQSQPQACLQPWRCPASSSAQSPGSPHCSWRSPPFGKLVHCCSHTGRLA